MKIFDGKSSVSLTDNDFLASGGQCDVYVKNDTAYKIYTDKKYLLPNGKIQELSVLTNPNIIKPKDLLYDNKNKEIGYSMRYVKDTYSLCQLFTRSFRDRNHITPDMIFDLVKLLQNMIKEVHDKKILIVDLNELNFLLNNSFKEIFAIDVDSWQTKSFPAVAIMDNIRDRHSKVFSELTDWFSFAVLSFNMFAGIGPYKGKHSSVKTLDERMKQNLSVLNKDVRVPDTAYPFSIVPEVYLKWYEAVFERGARLPPPEGTHAVIALINVVKLISGSNNFDINELFTYDENISSVFFVKNQQFTLTENEFLFNHDSIKVPENCQIVTTEKYNVPIIASIENKKLKLFNTKSREYIGGMLGAESMMVSNNTLYTKDKDMVFDISFLNENQDAQNLIATSKRALSVMVNATKMYPGCVIQNMLRSIFVSIFPGKETSKQIRISELDDYKIVTAKYESNVLMVLGIKNGKEDRLVFRFDDEKYDLRIIEDVNFYWLNFVVLDSGICVCLTDDQEIEIFSSKKDSQGLKIINDPAISGQMKLFKNGVKVLFGKDNKLYSLNMKGNKNC